jgi:cell division protein FtsB
MKKLLLVIVLAVLTDVVFADATAAQATKKQVMKGYNYDTLKADLKKTDSLYQQVCADTAKLKQESKAVKEEVAVLKDKQSTMPEKVAAFVGLIAALIALYEMIAGYWKTAKNISIVRRLLSLIPNKAKGGGEHPPIA